MTHRAALLPLLALFLAGCGNRLKENPAWPAAHAHILSTHSTRTTEVGPIRFLAVKSVETDVRSCVATQKHVTFVTSTKVTWSDRRRSDPLQQVSRVIFGGDFLPDETFRYRDEVVLLPRDGTWQVYLNSCKTTIRK